MMPPDEAIENAVRASYPRVQSLHAELHDTHPTLRGTLAVAGMFVGHGLGSFVANGMTNDQIVAHVLAIVAEVRQQIPRIAAEAADDVAVS